MKNNRKLETPDLKPYVIPLIVLCGIFLVASFFMMYGIRNHYYQLKKQEALKIARSYVESLEKLREAEEIIEGFLSEKISVAARTASFSLSQFSNETLKLLARELEVDEIDYYSPDGVLLYSNLSEVLGWVIYPGHPIDVFLKSGEESLVEDMRQDVITGNYYKYGYLKTKDGGLLQVGLNADRVHSFLEKYEAEYLLKEMQVNQDALSISLLDADLEILATTKEEKSLFLPEKEKPLLLKALQENREHTVIADEDGFLYYKVFLPLEEKEEGAVLSVTYTMQETLEAIRHVTTYGLVLLLLLFSVLLYSLRVSYEKNRKLRRIAFYDRLTGLPNKEYLLEWRARYGSASSKYTLMLLNISNFKHINVTYGYDFGDLILQEVSRRLAGLQKKTLYLFRFSVDRFILLKEGTQEKESYHRLAKEVLRIFEEPITVNDLRIPLQITLGGAVSADKKESLSDLLKNATVALEEGKKKNQSETLYDKEMMHLLKREEDLLLEMREAVEKKDDSILYLHFQPIMSKKEEVLAFEALARMRSKTYGQVSPLEFIELAEKNQLIQAVSDCILDCALDFMLKLQKEGKGHLRVAVNISGYQLLQGDFSADLLHKLKASGVRLSMLEVEITESVLFENFRHINEILKKLRSAGVRVALDDFGTGYSSFGRLQELHLDTIKIDQAFIRRIRDPKEETLVSDMIRMAHRMKLRVVAEGVEEEFQKENLLYFGCDALQGYYYAKPSSPEKALAFLQEQEEIFSGGLFERDSTEKKERL